MLYRSSAVMRRFSFCSGNVEVLLILVVCRRYRNHATEANPSQVRLFPSKLRTGLKTDVAPRHQGYNAIDVSHLRIGKHGTEAPSQFPDHRVPAVRGSL